MPQIAARLVRSVFRTPNIEDNRCYSDAREESLSATHGPTRRFVGSGVMGGAGGEERLGGKVASDWRAGFERLRAGQSSLMLLHSVALRA